MKKTKIEHHELITETHLHKVNELRVITGDDHVIIEEKKHATTRRSVDKEDRVMVTWLKASISDNRGEVLKPGPRSRQTIQEGTKYPGDGCMLTSSYNSPFKKAFLTSSWEMDHCHTEETTRRSQTMVM